MTYAKVELFDEKLQEAALFFKVLSHPARLAILNYLANSKVCISGDISNELPLSRTTVNQHLKELKELGLIRGTIDRAKTNYCLNKSRIDEMQLAIDQFLKGLSLPEGFSCKS